MVRIASFNVENLFERPKAFHATDLAVGNRVECLPRGQYSNKESRLQPADRLRIRELLVDT